MLECDLHPLSLPFPGPWLDRAPPNFYTAPELCVHPCPSAGPSAIIPHTLVPIHAPSESCLFPHLLLTGAQFGTRPLPTPAKTQIMELCPPKLPISSLAEDSHYCMATLGWDHCVLINSYPLGRPATAHSVSLSSHHPAEKAPLTPCSQVLLGHEHLHQC